MKIEKFTAATENGVKDRGSFDLYYGKSGVGKTSTILQTAEDPILWIIAERGQADLIIKAINRLDLRVFLAYYDGWDDLLETVYTPNNFKEIKTTLFDGLTHVMNIHLTDEILEENFDARDQSKDRGKDFTSRVKMTQESYGVLSKQMSRLMKGFELLTREGIDVICTARDQENPKWDRALACAPALSGKEFPRDMKGVFDCSGLVESRFNDDGVVIYPPIVSCDDDGSYLSKWTGIKPPGGVIRKIFNVKTMHDIASGRKIIKRKEGETNGEKERQETETSQDETVQVDKEV